MSCQTGGSEEASVSRSGGRTIGSAPGLAVGIVCLRYAPLRVDLRSSGCRSNVIRQTPAASLRCQIGESMNFSIDLAEYECGSSRAAMPTRSHPCQSSVTLRVPRG